MSSTTNSGIETSADGISYVPSSQRADGSTRKAIRVRPGFKPQEDVETYKNRNAEAWKNRGSGGIPGAEGWTGPETVVEPKSKNAKRREAAKKRQLTQEDNQHQPELVGSLEKAIISSNQVPMNVEPMPLKPTTAPNTQDESNLEQQKKIRNLLKKLGGIQELKTKKNNGEKLSPDQLMKLGREQELLRDLKKLGHTDTDPVNDNEEAILQQAIPPD